MKLWRCALGYWVCVVQAATADEALAKASQAWEEAEGWDYKHEWIIRPPDEHEPPDTVSVGWV